MCWDLQFRMEFEAMDRLWNKRLLEETRGKFKTPFYHRFAFNRPGYPVVCSDLPDEFILGRWTLVPNHIESERVPEWVKTTSSANAKSETIYRLPTFQAAAKAGRRCLVPLTGWYEYRHFRGKTYPYVIKRIDRKPFAFGGLWERRVFNEQEVTTFAVLTTTPNKLASMVHNNGLRMPVYVPEESFGKWLDPTLLKYEVLAMCAPAPDGMFEAWTVDRKKLRGPKVNSNVPDVDEPFAYPELPPLGMDEVQTALF